MGTRYARKLKNLIWLVPRKSELLMAIYSQKNWQMEKRNAPNIEQGEVSECRENTHIGEPYVKDYIKVLIRSEQSYLNLPRNFRTNTTARNIVVDWMIHVHDRYELAQTVLHKTVSLMDEFSSRRHVPNNSLQLVGVACMSLTIKNAGTPIQTNTLVNICGSYFTKDDLHNMEIEVIKMAQFDLNHPVCPQFLLVLQEHFHIPPNILSMTKYLLDLWLFHHDFGKYRPSVLASSALLFAFHATKNHLEIPKWLHQLTCLFKITKHDMERTVSALYKTIHHFVRNKYPAVREKYSTENFIHIPSNFQSLYEIHESLNII